MSVQFADSFMQNPLQKMSSSNSKSVSATIPVFTGANYAAWWPSMTAYLQSTGCMWIAKFTEPVLGESSTKDDRDFFIAWTKANDTIVGSIKNTFFNSLKLKHQAVSDAKTLLKILGDEYAMPGIAGAYALFKELLDCKVTSSAHLEPSINKILTIYVRLESAGFELSDELEAMFLLAKLPASMSVVAQMIVQKKDSAGKTVVPKVAEIKAAAILSWDQCSMMEPAPSRQQAQKISAVKCKGDDPNFEEQQAPKGDGSKKKWKRGKRAGKQQKERQVQASSEQPHAHIASVTYTSGPEPPVDPRALAHRPASAYQGQQGPPFHTGIKDTIALAHRLELPVTMENVCGLDTGLQILGPGFLSATVRLPQSSFSSSPCPPSPLFSSAPDTTPLEYRLEDEWLNGDSSASRSLLY